MTSHLRPALSLLILLTLITGLLYPLAVTGLAQLVFPWQANGSVLARQGRAVGSALIGQNFTAPGYFWSRPSATATYPYNGLASGGSNLGPTNPALREAVRARIAALRAADPGNTAPVPVDLVTASASGLDPDISLAAARYQAARVARVRHLPLARVQALIDAQAHPRWLGLFGTPRVNVLELNLALDGTPPQRAE
ncbi:potassium translocating ATPase, subunit C [Thiomonas arsenitoxydans]|uniref:Potassium-transporting ATPase KdpC subunit n=1 Tax=Thiomonas arsenitoxydans (strain DSM 22701 / CIP 110005 / 3As) TaxID=426114 RepID=D6CVQ3_THIA3|nr:potassium-transporting ATPase subunit KdpC [Thiomonas arsenitoxydans]CAZ86834.1 Potassium-transporting ATPase C chain (Potassium-translocating ATPase C chain) (ATP phosphohydrolase [potassium-transporting] C chain) (Potassium-binding and translocating subunit C) [Thiomonas arsenitoxydans]CQR28255.1 potassium translocating ATPase, subunit C [Thiomonas arsenitoxydans]CQR30726.1 potassium translocating ATPase, subunit C [Thiomonas arsenitoxydans]